MANTPGDHRYVAVLATTALTALPSFALAAEPAPPVEPPVEVTSTALTDLAKRMAKIDAKCVEIYDIVGDDRDAERKVLRAESASCAEQQDHLLAVAKHDAVAAAQLWWVLQARELGLLTDAASVLAGIVLPATLPAKCAKHQCDARTAEIVEQLAKTAAVEPRMHRVVYALQELAAARLPHRDAKRPLAAQRAQSAVEARQLAGDLGCVPAPWQEDGAPQCAPWWASWWATHRGRSDQWPQMAKVERLAQLQSPDLALRWSALDLGRGRDGDPHGAVLIAAARPVWLDASTPRRIAQAFADAVQGISWRNLLLPDSPTPVDLAWAIVPQTAPPGPPDDPTATALKLPALTAKQAKLATVQTAQAKQFIADCNDFGAGDEVGDSSWVACEKRGRQLAKLTDTVVAAHVLVGVVDGSDGTIGRDSLRCREVGQPGSQLVCTLRDSADPGTVVALLAQRLAKEVHRHDAEALAATIELLRTFSGVGVCSVLPWDTGKTGDCAHHWLGFAAAHQADTKPSLAALGASKALAGATSIDLSRRYAACEVLALDPKPTSQLALAWAIRNVVISRAVPVPVREAFIGLLGDMDPLDMLYPALPGQKSLAPNLNR